MFIPTVLTHLVLIAPSYADDVDIHVVVGDRPLAVPADEPPPPAEAASVEDDDDHDHRMVSVHDHHEDEGDEEGLQLQYGMLFLPQAPAHHLVGKFVADSDSYVSADLRYMPQSDLLWTGRLGAGIDVLGGGSWDVTLGLFVGSAGTWDRNEERAILYSTPMGGTEIGLGVESRHLYARYRWLAGLGTGPVDRMLTENELTVGYKLFDDLSVYGQWLRVNPGAESKRGGVGLGVRAVF